MFSRRSQLPISASGAIPAEQSQSISTIPGWMKNRDSARDRRIACVF